MKTHLILLVTFTWTMAATSVTAYSHRRFFYGDNAAMTGGAGTAIVRDTGAVWYNPAGLGGNLHQKLQVSGTAYGVAIRHLDNILQTQLDHRVYATDQSINTIGIVPSAFVMIFQWNDRVSLGLGLYQTEKNDIHLRAVQQLGPLLHDSTWNVGVEYHEQLVQYTVGPALGIKITRHLRWGIANFGVYYSQDASLRFNMGFKRSPEAGMSDPFTLDSQYVQARLLGTLITTGFQWQLSDTWHGGLMFRSPTFLLWWKQDASRYDAYAVEGLDDSASNNSEQIHLAQFIYRNLDYNDLDFKMVIPAEIQVSVVHRIGKNWIGADAAYQFPLKRENQKGVFNANLGGYVNLSPKFGLGVGLFTDNDSQCEFEGALTLPGRRFGATAGIQFRSAELVETVSNSPEHKKEHQRRTLLTTLAFSYSMQLARFQSFNFVANPSDETYTVSVHETNAIFHRFEIHFGGGFYF
jgi:hypothetical protein